MRCNTPSRFCKVSAAQALDSRTSFIGAMIDLPRKLRDWLKTKQGMSRVMEEIKKRKVIYSCRIGMIDISVATLKVYETGDQRNGDMKVQAKNVPKNVFVGFFLPSAASSCGQRHYYRDSGMEFVKIVDAAHSYFGCGRLGFQSSFLRRDPGGCVMRIVRQTPSVAIHHPLTFARISYLKLSAQPPSLRWNLLVRFFLMQGLIVVKQELLVFAEQRKRQFEDGEPFHFHSLNSSEEATALVEAAEKEVTDIRGQVNYEAPPGNECRIERGETCLQSNPSFRRPATFAKGLGSTKSVNS